MLLDAGFVAGYREFRDGYKQHNAAMKWFRESQEREDPAAARPILFSNMEPVQVAKIVHADKGMNYELDETQTVPWFWLEMVAQMKAESIHFCATETKTAVAV